MGKKVARLMARIIALEEAMALMLRGSLNHGIKKKKAKPSKHKKITAKKAKAIRPKKAVAKKAASKKAAAEMAVVEKAVRAASATSAIQPTVKPVAIAKLAPAPVQQAAMPPRPAPVPAAR
jgi:hypothetical protein